MFCLPRSPGAAQVKALVKTQRDSEVLVQRLWHVCAAGRAGMGSRGSRGLGAAGWGGAGGRGRGGM